MRTNLKKKKIKYSVCIRSKFNDCKYTECNYYINYSEENNCLLNSIERNEKLSLKDISKRLKIPASTVNLIKNKALKRLSKNFTIKN